MSCGFPPSDIFTAQALRTADPQISCVCAQCARRTAALVAPATGTSAHAHTPGSFYSRVSSRLLPPCFLPSHHNFRFANRSNRKWRTGATEKINDESKWFLLYWMHKPHENPGSATFWEWNSGSAKSNASTGTRAPSLSLLRAYPAQEQLSLFNLLTAFSGSANAAARPLGLRG